MEITVSGDARNVIHKNLMLVSADAPEQAYQRALDLGRESETSYKNPSGDFVNIAFKGISQLERVYDELEHGAELMFSYQVGVSPEQISSLIPSKGQLGVFRPPRRAEGPDYASGEVTTRVEDEFGFKRPT